MKSKISVEGSLFVNEFLNVFFEDNFTRIGKRVDCVPHAVDEPSAVERLLVDDFFNVSGNLFAVVIIFDVFANVAHNAYKFQIRAANKGNVLTSSRHHGFHNIAGRSLHDNIACKINRQVPCLSQNVFELRERGGVGHDAHNQQVGNFFKAEFVAQAVDQRIYFVPAVPQFARTWFLFAVSVQPDFAHNF